MGMLKKCVCEMRGDNSVASCDVMRQWFYALLVLYRFDSGSFVSRLRHPMGSQIDDSAYIANAHLLSPPHHFVLDE